MSLNIVQIRISYHLTYAKRQTANSQLQRTVAFNFFNHVGGYLSVDFRRRFRRQFCQWAVASFNHMVYRTKIELCLITVGYRHILIYLYDYFLGSSDYSPHICHLRPQVKVSVLIHRCDLKHGDINIIIVVSP